MGGGRGGGGWDGASKGLRVVGWRWQGLAGRLCLQACAGASTLSLPVTANKCMFLPLFAPCPALRHTGLPWPSGLCLSSWAAPSRTEACSCCWTASAVRIFQLACMLACLSVGVPVC